MRCYNGIKKFIVSIALGLLLYSCFSPQPLYAGVSAQPDSTELIVTPGQVTNGSFTVHNDGAENIHVNVQPEPWPKKTGEGVVPVDQWLKIDSKDFDLAPNENKQVKYAISMPQDSGPELISMVFFATTAPQGAFNVTSRYGVSVYATRSDKMNVACELETVELNANIITTDTGKINKGLVFALKVTNKGNVHIRPTGYIVITSESGAIYDVPIVRDFPVYPSVSLNQFEFWNKTDILPGKYTADINLDYGKLYNIDGKIQRKVSFVVNEDGTVSL